VTRPPAFGVGHVPADLGPTVVTIGNFDGVHLGHRAMLARVAGIAAKHARPAGAVTFVPHPAEVLRPGSQPRLLTGLRHKVTQLCEAGMDFEGILPFTAATAARSAESFAEETLFTALRAVAVVVGSNFRFGHGAAGDVALLARLGERRGVEVHGIELAEAGGAAVSSSRIRDALGAGDVAAAAAMLGRPYALEGRVVVGAGRGRTIGVPTANLGVPRRLLIPANGVYAGHLSAGPPDRPDGPPRPAVVNVGVNPTFGGTALKVEAHVLDADVELRGRRVCLTFERRLRGERRFAGVDELLAQIHRDVDDARRLLA
jgi:riboflavin kinase/FMN adenylyltransferase